MKFAGMKFAGPVTALAAAATTAAALVIGSAVASADPADGRPDSAYGLALTGLIPLAPTPLVESRDGEPVSRTKVQIGSLEGGLGTGLLSVSAEAGRAEATASKVRLQQLLSADLIRTTCEDGSGGLEVVNGVVLGHKVPSGTIHDQTVPLGPLGSMTLGNQMRHEDGSTTVTGIVLTLFPGVTDPATALTSAQKAAIGNLGLPGGLSTVGDALNALANEVPGAGDAVQTITVGSATCNPYAHPDEPGAIPDAPAPTVVPGHLPVTG
jgi:hypothetical protein